MNIGKRIALGFGCVIAIAILLGLSAWVELSDINVRADRMGDDHLPGILLSGRIENAQATGMVHTERMLSASNDHDLEAAQAGLAEVSKENDARVKAYEQTIHTQRDRQLFDALLEARQKYRTTRNQELVPL